MFARRHLVADGIELDRFGRDHPAQRDGLRAEARSPLWKRFH